MGCLYHFKAALWRKAQSLGLSKSNEKGGYRSETRKLIKKLANYVLNKTSK